MCIRSTATYSYLDSHFKVTLEKIDVKWSKYGYNIQHHFITCNIMEANKCVCNTTAVLNVRL